jgi:hypothetical protein
VQLVPRARSQVQPAQRVRQAQLVPRAFKVKPARLALKARRVQLVRRARSQVQLVPKVFKVKPAQLARKVPKAFKA